jgi:hypothetical protein
MDSFYRIIWGYSTLVRQMLVHVWMILHTARCDRDSLRHVLWSWRKLCENLVAINVRLVNVFCTKCTAFSWSTGNRDVEICALLVNYAAYSDTSLPTFRGNVLAPSSGVFNSWPLKMGPLDCPITSVHNYHYTLRNFTEERRSHLLRVESLKSLERFCSYYECMTEIRNQVYWRLFITSFNTFTIFKTRRIQWINIESYNNKNAQTWLWFLLNLNTKFPNYQITLPSLRHLRSIPKTACHSPCQMLTL